MRMAVVLDSLQQPLRKALTTAAEMEVQGVVLTAGGDLAPSSLSDTGRRELRRMLETTELKAAALALPSRRPLLAADGRDGRDAALREALEFAYQMRAPVVCCPLGPIPHEDDPQREPSEEMLADLGQFAERTGVRLSLWCGSNAPADVYKLLARRDTGGLGIGYDPAMLLVSGHDPVSAVAILREWIVHVHVRDAVRGGGPESSTEVALGRGEVDWPECLGALEEAEYRGFFAVQRSTGPNPRRDVSLAVEYFRNLAIA